MPDQDWDESALRVQREREVEEYTEEVRPGQTDEMEVADAASAAAPAAAHEAEVSDRARHPRGDEQPAGGPQNPPPQVQDDLQERRDRGDAPPVPQRRKRIPAQRQALPPARHSGHLHGHRPGTGILRADRAGTHRADPQLQADRPPQHHRRGRRNHQVQDPQAAGRSAPGRRQAEPCPHQRHLRRSYPADEFAEAPGGQGRALCQAARRDARTVAHRAGQPLYRARCPGAAAGSRAGAAHRGVAHPHRGRAGDGFRARRAHPARLRHRRRGQADARTAEPDSPGDGAGQRTAAQQRRALRRTDRARRRRRSRGQQRNGPAAASARRTGGQPAGAGERRGRCCQRAAGAQPAPGGVASRPRSG